MQAVYCTRYGAPDVLDIREVPKPVPKADEVLIRVHAATVTSGDCRMRSFDVPPMFWIPGRLALGLRRPRAEIPGTEMAGIIEAVGARVQKFAVGDAVIAYAAHSVEGAAFGANAEYRAMNEQAMIVHKPENLSFEQAAGLSFGGLTALNFLRAGQIQAGQSILINGASGAVGTYAVQLAKHFGAEVTAVCSGRNVEMVRSLGADHLIDYQREDCTRGGVQYDVVFDAVGKRPFREWRPIIKPNGVMLHAVMVLYELKAPWFERWTGIRVVGGSPESKLDDLQELAELAEAGIIRPVVDRCYELEDIVQAHHYVDTGRKRGIVAIRMA